MVESAPALKDRKIGGRRVVRLLRGGPFAGIWVATAILFAVSPLVASGSLSNSSIQAILPFAGVLAIAAAGQTLVIQQGGLDLSVPGIFSLGLVFSVTVPGGDSSRLLLGLLVALGAGLAAGLANGLAVTRLHITPLVATLGMNGIILGVVQQATGGSINFAAAPNWADFVGSKVLGITTIAILAVILIAVGALVLRRSVWGREFELVGAAPRAARAAGLPVVRYQLASYALAGVCYALAGALLAGFLGRVQLGAGDSYLLPTVAAVILGGTALGGGRGSLIATAGGVLFLSQLNQLLTVLGASQAAQYIVQGAIVALGMGLRGVPWSRIVPHRRADRQDPVAPDPASSGSRPYAEVG